MTGELVIEVGRRVTNRTRAEQLVRRALESEQRTLDSVSVEYVDQATMRRLNKQHRHKDRLTDVLSFPFGDDFPHGTGGEVVVCPECADPAGQGTLDRLLVHGVLHLLGYEDDTEAQLAEMERRTDRVLEGFGG